MKDRIFEVLEKKDVSGLTVGNRSLPPGSKFSIHSWKWGDESLKAALKDKRCKEITKETLSDKDNEKIENMKAAYDKMDPESDKAKKLLDKIQDIES